MKIKPTLILLALVFGLISCSKDKQITPTAQTSTPQTANLKSAPSTTTTNDGLIHLFIRGVDNTQFVAGGGTLTHIDLVQKGNSNKEKRVTIFDQSWHWYPTPTGAEYFNDLLDMYQGIMIDLANGDVNPPPGDYDFAVATVEGTGWLKDKDGNTYPVKFPGNQFILKFKPALKIATELSTDVVLDIDINRSFVKTGNFYIFKPVVKVANLTTNGSLYGGVYTYNADYSDVVPVPGATISVDGVPSFVTYDQPIPVPGTDFTIEPGQYWIPGLPAGSYTVSASADGYTTYSTQVTIVEGNFTQQFFLLMPTTTAP
ncbi:MAG: carboxypeptidase regulatory-like domain-containing protein [Bacteroidales bacterium]|nr:carboxypeptidase regulatory-like domain-containing protein [Bacteroidales bacterium]